MQFGRLRPCTAYFLNAFVECAIASHCSALCTMDNTCLSAIFDETSKICHLFTESQSSSLVTSSEGELSVVYFEKFDCDWATATLSDLVCRKNCQLSKT